MDSESLRTMALLEARSEYNEMNEEDVEFDVEEELTETEAEIQTEAEVQTETQATASTQAAKPQRSKYPTSNIYFTQVWNIQLLLEKYSTCDDLGVREMARDMQVKFDKYWKEYSLILAMGAVLDPRIKIEMLEASYKELDPSTASLKTEKLKESLSDLYKEYQKLSQTSSSGFSLTPHEIVTESPLEDDYDNDFFELEKSIGGGAGDPKTHLDIYLEEPRLNRRANINLDVLTYWRDNQHRFGDLASMAREILSIPITTVASESAFSAGSRVLTPYRNRLLPKNVQALLCTRNWLRGFAEYQGTIEDLFDESENVQKKQVVQELSLQRQKIEVFDRIMKVIRCV